MQKILRFPLLAALAIVLALPSCSKEEAAPKPGLAGVQRSSDINMIDWRGDSYCFTSEAGINLTNLPAGSPCVMMYRKNFQAIQDDKANNRFEGQINPADYPSVAFPYEWTGKFRDQDPRAYGYVWDVIFRIDQRGHASATLRWSGTVDLSGLPPL